MSDALKQTPLYAAHVAAGGRMVPFAGYEMPVQYSGLVDEHTAVRTAVGLFDVSHMGEVMFTGPEALKVVNRIITNDLEKLADGQACYTAMLKEDGGIVDDLVVYRFSPEKILICVNASNRAKDFAWMKAQAKDACQVEDQSDAWVQIAVQGPKAAALVQRLTAADLSGVKTYWFVEGQVAGKAGIIARTGYTGEDGFELYVGAADGEAVWQALLQAGADLGVKPCGLGARDSLRLEFCYALYGNDIDEGTNPLEAGLGWVVKLSKAGGFVGQAALQAIKAAGPTRKLVPFELTGRGIARQHYPVLVNGEKVGEVTSGTMGPSVGKAIGLAYLPVSHSAEGSAFQVEIRGKPVDAVVVSRPFLKR
jgi:aminomethyltransferase